MRSRSDPCCRDGRGAPIQKDGPAIRMLAAVHPSPRSLLHMCDAGHSGPLGELRAGRRSTFVQRPEQYESVADDREQAGTHARQIAHHLAREMPDALVIDRCAAHHHLPR